MKINDIKIFKIFDSRSQATIEITLHTDKGVFRGAVPSGKSTGKREAKVFAFAEAKKSVEKIRKAIEEKDFSSIVEFDGFLRELDGTKDKSVLGGNVMLAASIAFARARAAEKGVSLWLLLRREFFPHAKESWRPTIFSNVINGGAHAESGLAIQEYMIVLRPGKSASDDVELLCTLYLALGDVFRKKLKTKNIPIGDEAGYSVKFADNFEPIKTLEKLLKDEKVGKRASIALDAAATNFGNAKKGYTFDGETLSTEKLVDLYTDWFKKSKLLCSIEDPFAEDDTNGFISLQKKIKEKWVVGDDLTTTNPESIHALHGAIHGVIIKSNQIGTVSESCEAMITAQKDGVKTIVSHRSGETEDNFLISLAKAGNADGVKIGAPAHERMLKFNKLIRLYDGA
jgi:enolase